MRISRASSLPPAATEPVTTACAPPFSFPVTRVASSAPPRARRRRRRLPCRCTQAIARRMPCRMSGGSMRASWSSPFQGAPLGRRIREASDIIVHDTRCPKHGRSTPGQRGLRRVVCRREQVRRRELKQETARRGGFSRSAAAQGHVAPTTAGAAEPRVRSTHPPSRASVCSAVCIAKCRLSLLIASTAVARRGPFGTPNR